ncbi:PDR/VanB family oxidoreductase [Paucibacter sediminis]|uniref:PDR/VanB family oxidoreductase n=1 Tax=Paucibacter sediminis TaxID=3019553 RepID=A0AA95SR26_9BURK|nr:PDR/VanB family oxidoreductase [Paucibacter sp. S2-9]WIT14195.1 PDR/VanB family oxidoreductase [Paucibacter sp. S2-9]
MKLVVHQILQHGAAVREIRLRDLQGQVLPAWHAGAHLRLQLPLAQGEPLQRHYSLLGPEGAAQEYRIAVLQDPNSRGGSRWIHTQLREGALLEVDAPVDSFPLQAGQGRSVLVGGGIGITPMHAMAHALNARGQDFELHYLARSAERLVLLDELRALPHARLHLHVGGTAAALDDMLGRYQAGASLHGCGPVPLLNTLRERGAALGWPEAALHFESFGARAASGDRPLRVHMALSGKSVDVAPGTSILDALIAADAFVPYDCKRGECGQCHSRVLDGSPLHRDLCLSAAQREQGLCICVGWASSAELTLEL